jgi:sodium/proline symporter
VARPDNNTRARQPMNMSSLLAFLLYILTLISIGLFYSKRHQTASGFILGNRNLSYWVTAISANASDMSVWLFMGLPMAVFAQGLIQIWTAIGLIVFMFLNWHVVAPKLRKATEDCHSITLFSFFEHRIGGNARFLRILGAIFATIFLTIYISAGITGMGYLFESIFSINYVMGCTISVLAILIYVSIGGFTAICHTDFFQGIFLLIIILLVPSLIFWADIPHAHNHQALKKVLEVPWLPTDISTAFSAFTLACGWGLGYFGQPHIINKFMAIKNPKELYKSKWLSTAWQILALGGAILSGLAAVYFFSYPPKNPELLFVDMVHALFNPFLASLVSCAILAATLSTIDSQVLVIASAVAEDFYASIIKKPTDKNILKVSRLTAIIICLIALGIALLKITSIFELVYYCWVGIGSAFGPLVIASLYFKNLTERAALVSMLAGGLTGGLWITLNTPISATLPGFLAGLLGLWICRPRK